MRRVIKALQAHRWTQKLKKLVHQPLFAQWYVFVAVLILAITTTTWATLGAKLNATNADQLSDPYLFESGHTFQQASFPGAHTFLIKWPLFLLVRLFGFTNEAFLALTTLTVLLTVGALAYVLYRIERRPLVFGTLCLALASVLLLVPTVPTAGTLLPVNMAMLTSRNLEYMAFVAVLVLLVRAKRWFSWQAIAGVALFVVLIASDKLFVSLSLGSALLALLVYVLVQRWRQASLSAWWLVTTIVGSVLAVVLLCIVGFAHITHISSQASSGPYGLQTNLKQLVLGGVYGGLGVLTNFGANPAFDEPLLRHVVHTAANRLLSPSGLAFAVNLLIFGLAVFAATKLIAASLRKKKRGRLAIDRWAHVALGLVSATLVAFSVFVFTNHYYAGDARYLTISLFAGFVTLAVYSRSTRPSSLKLVLLGALLFVGIVVALPVTLRSYWDDRIAITEVRGRNDLVAEALRQHPVQVLVGDYWRVLPIKNVAHKTQTVMPLMDCTTPRDALSSKAWQPSLKHRSFAYLLSLDGNLTDFPNCTYQQVQRMYGSPNASLVIAGRVSQPKELLLFYDRGTEGGQRKSGGPLQVSASIEPIPLDKLSERFCDGPTAMNIVAHQDDDLLFMNPDILHDIEQGTCERTVYVTAGDAGSNFFYWLGREQGTEAAYANMAGSTAVWVQHTVKLGNDQYATVASLADNPKISLIFLHLPDGNLNGTGFPSSHYSSLEKLQKHQEVSLNTVDSQSVYSYDDTTSVLVKLMHFYQPATIRTQSTYVSTQFPDHSDHMAVSRLTQDAYGKYEVEQYKGQVTIPIISYLGYPVRDFPENVAGADLERKEAIFLTYAKYDGGVCQSSSMCDVTPTYGSYLRREYPAP